MCPGSIARACPKESGSCARVDQVHQVAVILGLACSLSAAAQSIASQSPPGPSSISVRSSVAHDGLRWDAKEVVKELDLRSYLFVELTLTGAEFPMMAQLPVVRVGRVRSHHVIVSDDRRTAYAYFRQELRDGDAIAFGFGDVVLFRSSRPFKASELRRLDRSRLPKGVE